MPEAPSSWLTPKTLVLLANLGLGTVVSLFLIWDLARNGPATKALAEDIKSMVATVMQQHQDIAPKIEEGNRIQCAQCYIMARGDEESVKLCGCDATKR